MIVFAALRQPKVHNPNLPAWLGKVQLLEALGCTEKQLAEEYTAGTIMEYVAYLKIRSQVEELEAKRMHIPSVPHIPRR